MSEIKYVVKETIQLNVFPNGSKYEPINSLLVGELNIYEWDTPQDGSGREEYKLYPAYYKGEKAWVLWKRRNSIANYIGEGEGEEILSFEDGVKLLIKNGAYEWMFPRPEEEEK